MAKDDSSSRVDACSILRRARYRIGGSPIARVNRSANDERESPISLASDSVVQCSCIRFCSRTSARPTNISRMPAMAAIPPVTHPPAVIPTAIVTAAALMQNQKQTVFVGRYCPGYSSFLWTCLFSSRWWGTLGGTEDSDLKQRPLSFRRISLSLQKAAGNPARHQDLLFIADCHSLQAKKAA